MFHKVIYNKFTSVFDVFLILITSCNDGNGCEIDTVYLPKFRGRVSCISTG